MLIQRFDDHARIDNESCDGPSSETFKHALDAAILTILCDNYHFIVFILLSINMHILYLCILNVLLDFAITLIIVWL